MRLAPALLAIAMLAPAGVWASTLSPYGKRMLDEQERQERETADVVVVGRWQGTCSPEWCSGNIVPTRHRRGKRLARYPIEYRAELDLYSGSNEPPELGTCALFYLDANTQWNKGSYEVVQYKRLGQTSKACVK